MKYKYLAVACCAASLFAMPAMAQTAVVAPCVTAPNQFGSFSCSPVTTTNPLPVTTGSGGANVTIIGPLGNQAKAAAISTTSATASAVAPSVVALSTTAGVVLASSTALISRTVCNDDSAITEYFGPSGVTNAGANGVRLLPGQCWDFSHNTAAIYGVSASATPNARVVQY